MKKKFGFEDVKCLRSLVIKSDVDKETNTLDEFQATRCKSWIVRGNDFVDDRLDIQFTCRECSISMSKSTGEDWEKLKRSGRYLKG